MLDYVLLTITGCVSAITLCLSRCRCIIRQLRDETGQNHGIQWGLGFSDAQLFPVPTAGTIVATPLDTIPPTIVETGIASPSPHSVR